MIAQFQFAGMRVQVDLPLQIGLIILADKMVEQGDRNDQRQQALPIVLDEAQELQPTAGRPCRRSRSDS